jgi:hypothetical protein
MPVGSRHDKCVQAETGEIILELSRTGSTLERVRGGCEILKHEACVMGVIELSNPRVIVALQ